VGDVDLVLAKYSGKETEMWGGLVGKYGEAAVARAKAAPRAVSSMDAVSGGRASMRAKVGSAEMGAWFREHGMGDHAEACIAMGCEALHDLMVVMEEEDLLEDIKMPPGDVKTFLALQKRCAKRRIIRRTATTSTPRDTASPRTINPPPPPSLALFIR
jgi:hypothetical protein